jgi:predicted enzyme related to lactoylglutathione lyase
MTMLVTKDVVRARDFYRDVFGLKVGNDFAPHWVDFELGSGMQLGLHPAGEGMDVEPGSMSIGFSVDDVDAFVAEVAAKGVPVRREPRDENFGRLALLADPDGYTVQVFTPSKS